MKRKDFRRNYFFYTTVCVDKRVLKTAHEFNIRSQVNCSMHNLAALQILCSSDKSRNYVLMH